MRNFRNKNEIMIDTTLNVPIKNLQKFIMPSNMSSFRNSQTSSENFTYFGRLHKTTNQVTWGKLFVLVLLTNFIAHNEI